MKEETLKHGVLIKTEKFNTYEYFRRILYVYIRELTTVNSIRGCEQMGWLLFNYFLFFREISISVIIQMKKSRGKGRFLTSLEPLPCYSRSPRHLINLPLVYIDPHLPVFQERCHLLSLGHSHWVKYSLEVADQSL